MRDQQRAVELTPLFELMDVADNALDRDVEEQIRRVYRYDPPDDAEICLLAGTYFKILKVFSEIDRLQRSLGDENADTQARAIEAAASQMLKALESTHRKLQTAQKHIEAAKTGRGGNILLIIQDGIDQASTAIAAAQAAGIVAE